MPELPDLAILAEALDAGLRGRRLEGTDVREPLVVRGTPPELAALAGQRLESVSRRGKFLTFALERDRLVLNAMLTGRIGLASAGVKPWPRAAAVFRFSAREFSAPEAEGGEDATPDRLGSPTADWLAGEWLPPAAMSVEMRYRDATRMGKLYVVPVGVARQIAGWDEQGPDADSPELTLEEWRRRIGRHSGELKNLLRNQLFVAGIGNAYSDEILWAARLAPYRTRATLRPEEVDTLYDATRATLAWAAAELRTLVPPRLEVEQRGFLRVHAKGGQPCPRCGAPISSVKAGGSETNFCRSCQR